MEEKLQEIINDFKDENHILEGKVKFLRSRIEFCIQHKFEEEVRIARIELNAIEMPSYRLGKKIEEIQEFLNAWNS